jgi:HlyD family secretion protein
MRLSKRAIVFTSAAALLLGAGAVVLLGLSPAKENDLHFITAPISKGRIASKVTATGTLSALVTVQIGSQVSGRIKSLQADFNSQVKKGDLLATLDPQFFDAALEQARANADASEGDLAAAKVRAADAERTYQRAKSLAERNLIAQAELDVAQVAMQAARAAVVTAKGRLAQNRAQLNQAKVNLAYTKIYSPIDGVVISRNVDVGQTVAASLSAPTLFVLGEDLRKMQIDTSVSETDIGKMRAGMPAIFTVGAFPGERFTGTVRQIRNSPTTVLGVVSYNVVIDVSNPDLKLRPGMTATVTLIYAERDDVLRVPNAALRFRPPSELLATLATDRTKATGEKAAGGSGKEGGDGKVEKASAGDKKKEKKDKKDKKDKDGRQVWVLADGRPQPVPITPGITDGSFTEVVSDRLHEGDQVITDLETEDEASERRAAPGDAPKTIRKIF